MNELKKLYIIDPCDDEKLKELEKIKHKIEETTEFQCVIIHPNDIGIVDLKFENDKEKEVLITGGGFSLSEELIFLINKHHNIESDFKNLFKSEKQEPFWVQKQKSKKLRTIKR